MALFLILLIVPIVEIALFIEIGGAIGTWPTVGIVVLTALIGSILLRQQGLSALRSAEGRLIAGEAPGGLLAEGAMILFAGALLLTPGFFTDGVGFALLIPPVRRALWRWARTRLPKAGVHIYTARHGGPDRDRGADRDGATVDGRYSEADPADPDDAPPRRDDKRLPPGRR